MKDILGERDANIPDVPTRVAEPSREKQLPKRFYKQVTIEERDGRHFILLDGRSIKTPGREELALASADLAQVVADEWQAQDKRIDPMTMPMTRLVNTALDGVASDMQAVKEDIIRFSGSDLLCYRAGEPEGLVTRQSDHWDPVLDWAQSRFGCRFILAEGVMHQQQKPETIAAFGAQIGIIDDPLRLAGLHVMTSLTGSAILALAVATGHLSAEEAWLAAHVDEDWNIERWGSDFEAEARRDMRWRDMNAAAQAATAA